MWVLDGQHRVIAAMSRSDLSELPCLVFDELTVEDEARIFYTANNIRGSASPFDRLRALVIARDRLSIDVVEMMEAENYHPHATGGGNNTVCCIAAFVNAVKNSRDAVEQAWPLIAELHGGLVIKKNVFASLVYIARFGTDDIASPNWKKRVLKHGLHEIEAAIARARVLYQKGGSKVYAQATLEVLNKGVMQANKLGLRETDAQDDE
jgi:hypothetical protein